MSDEPVTPPRTPVPTGDAGAAVLLAALESAAAAIYYLADRVRLVWANARARELGTVPASSRWSTGDRWRTSSPRCCAPAGRADAARPDGRPGPVVSARVRPHGDRGGRRRAGHGRGGPGSRRRVPGWPTGSSRRSCRCCRRPCRCCPTSGCPGSYHRASSARAAGGDWYDAVPLGAGRVALVVGDAVGHGVPAAGAMSRLRGAMRSTRAARPLARASCSRRWTRFAAQMDDVEGASVFYGVLDAGTGTAHLRRRRPPAAAGRPRRRPDVLPPGHARGRRWAACPDVDHRDLRARPRAGRDARAVLQRRHRRRRRGAGRGAGPARRRLAVGPAGAPARWRSTPPPGWPPRSPRACAGRRAGRTTSPSWSRTAARRALEPLRAGPGRHARRAARRSAGGSAAGWPISAWASRTGSA